MTDFEIRARAAARAIHDAVDAPADELAPRRSGRGPVRALVIAAAVIVIAAIVGTTLAVRDEGAGPASDVTSFCAQVLQMVTTPVDIVNGERSPQAPSLEFLRDAPEEIRPEALAILAGNEQSRSPDDASSREFVRWWQLRCYPFAATPDSGPTNERYAPRPTPSAFGLCGASNNSIAGTPQQVADVYGTITIYGNRSLPDPYAGPMLGLVRSKRQMFYSDDHAVPAIVPGHPDAELVDATGTSGAPIDGLGQSVTWKDEHGDVTVIGRGYTLDQATELTGLAARVTDGPEGLALTDAERDGLMPLYSGPVADIYLRDASSHSSSTYYLSYNEGPDAAGGASLSGVVTGPRTLDAIRFFAPELHHSDLGGRDVITGDVAATNTLPGSVIRIAAWREGDVMLTLRSNGGPPPSAAAVTAFVTATRRLDRAEWETLIGEAGGCSWTESSSASGSDSSSGSSSETSTTTTPVGR